MLIFVVCICVLALVIVYISNADPCSDSVLQTPPTWEKIFQRKNFLCTRDLCTIQLRKTNFTNYINLTATQLTTTILSIKCL